MDATKETRATLVAALLYNGLACYDGRACISALTEIGEIRAADSLEFALSNRFEDVGVRDWEAEET